MTQETQPHFIVAWRIVEMDVWDVDYFDMEESATS